MISRLCKPVAVAVVLAAVAARSPRAAAEFVTLKYDHATSNPTVTSNLQANSPVGPFYWTENNLPPNTNFPPPTATFCIELAAGQLLPNPGTNVTFDARALSAGPLGGTTAGAAAKALAITELYGRFYDTAWDKSTFTGSAASVSFQIALWELVYDGKNTANTTSLNDGGFSISASFSQKATAQTWLNSLTGDTSSFATKFAGKELVALIAPAGAGAKTQDNIQDQITLRNSPIPAPPAVILAGLGAAMITLRTRLARRKSPAT
jgi:hypothetical protein